jgi:glycosyltransferase involved in cell wall biosynthesis
MEWVVAMPALFYPDFLIAAPPPKILKILKSFQPDIIHSHTPFTLGAAAIVAARYLKVPLVSTYHTFFSEPEYLRVVGLERFNKFNWLSRAGRQYTKIFLERGEATIAPSRYSAKFLRSIKIKKPLLVLPNGISLPLPRASARKVLALRKKYRLTGSVILSVGRLSPEKGGDLLIRAFQKIAPKFPLARLVFIGDGPSRSDLEKLTLASGLKERVIFVGAFPREELLAAGWHEIADCFATASTSDNIPLSLLEAMAKGLPIIAANARGHPELVQGNGLLVAPNAQAFAQAFTKILSREKLRRRFSLRSLKLIQAYGLKNHVTQLLRIYKNLIARYQKLNSRRTRWLDLLQNRTRKSYRTAAKHLRFWQS